MDVNRAEAYQRAEAIQKGQEELRKRMFEESKPLGLHTTSTGETIGMVRGPDGTWHAQVFREGRPKEETEGEAKAAIRRGLQAYYNLGGSPEGAAAWLRRQGAKPEDFGVEKPEKPAAPGEHEKTYKLLKEHLGQPVADEYLKRVGSGKESKEDFRRWVIDQLPEKDKARAVRFFAGLEGRPKAPGEGKGGEGTTTEFMSEAERLANNEFSTIALDPRFRSDLKWRQAELQNFMQKWKDQGVTLQTKFDPLGNPYVTIAKTQTTRTKGAPGAAEKPQKKLPPPPTHAETLSRKDPRYQQARQRGLTDQQIEQRFGLKLTD
jgi:hypothetical protein